VPLENVPVGPGQFATSAGLDQTRFQTLHDAEQTYASGLDLHSKDSYTGRNIQDLDDGYKQGEYMDSWTHTNAGQTNDKAFVFS
jgi:hypothetical protein